MVHYEDTEAVNPQPVTARHCACVVDDILIYIKQFIYIIQTRDNPLYMVILWLE